MSESLRFSARDRVRVGASTSWRVVLSSLLLAALASWTGCASSSPFNQSFVEVVTPNFHVTSSLGDAATRMLARDLEVFHAGVLTALGLEANLPPRTPTRVLAFDGRGPTRPFALRGESASLVPSIDGAILMVRAPGGFDERIGREVRHDYAHRVLRDHSDRALPLWYEEGRAQIASSVNLRENHAEVGGAIAAHRALVLDWRRGDLAGIVEQRQIARASELERRRFEARSWALAHTLLFAESSRRQGRSDLDRIRDAYERAGEWERPSVFDVLRTDETKLTQRVYEHLERETFRGTRVRVDGFAKATLELRPVPIEQARVRLGELALELERPELARDYFERALDASPEDSLALAGHALALARTNDFLELDALATRARAAGADRDAAKRELWLGLAFLARAERSADGPGRGAALEAARAALRASLASETQPVAGAEAWLGLAFCSLAAGDAGEPAQASLEQARARQPGALRLGLAAARLADALGRRAGAADEAGEVLSRTHWLPLVRAARPYLEAEDAR